MSLLLSIIVHPVVLYAILGGHEEGFTHHEYLVFAISSDSLSQARSTLGGTSTVPTGHLKASLVL